MNLHQVIANPTLDDIDREDHWARQEASRRISTNSTENQ
jgi:hypothetical protein